MGLFLVKKVVGINEDKKVLFTEVEVEGGKKPLQDEAPFQVSSSPLYFIFSTIHELN